MNLTWAQKAMVEYIMKNPNLHAPMIVERRWLTSGKNPGMVAELVQKILQRHEALWSTVSVSGGQARKMSQIRMTQELDKRRTVELTIIGTSAAAELDAWRQAEPRIWQSKGGSLWEGGTISFNPRVLIVSNNNDECEIFLRIGHTGIDAYSIEELYAEFRDTLNGLSLPEAPTLQEQVDNESSAIRVRMAQRAAKHLRESIKSAGKDYLFREFPETAESPHRVTLGFPLSDTLKKAERLEVTPAQLWLAALVVQTCRYYGGEGALFKAQATVRAGGGTRSQVAPITRSAVLRVDIEPLGSFATNVTAVADATARAFMYANYDPTDLWLAEESRESEYGQPVNGQILFNIRNELQRRSKISAGHMHVDSDAPLSFDQKIQFNVDIFPHDQVVAASVTAHGALKKVFGEQLLDQARDFIVRA